MVSITIQPHPVEYSVKMCKIIERSSKQWQQRKILKTESKNG